MRGSDASERHPPGTQAIQDQLGEPYRRYHAAARRLHAQLVSTVLRPDDLALATEQRGDREWTLTVCMADHVGGLSVIAGLLTAHQIDVTGAGVFTLTLDVSDGAPAPAASGRRTRRRRRPQRAPVPARLMLGIFELRTLEPAAPDWDAFERDLQAAVSMMAGSGLDTVRALVMDRVSETVRLDEQRETRLLPVSIDVDQEASPDATVMRISSSDTPGFLFEFTNALALLDANIARAEIRTGEEVAQDTFWLTDARAAQGHGRGAA